MHRYVINGKKQLEGSINIKGAKNAVLKIMAASILAEGTTTIKNVPKIKDVFIMGEVLTRLGAKVDFSKKQEVTIDTTGSLNDEAPYELVRQMRASIIVLGPLVAKLGSARVAMPGGCNIGSRKIDMHIQGLKKLGAYLKVGHGYIQARTDGLKGELLPLDFPSVGATENLLMAAVLAEGLTVIENAAREPEIVDLADFLNKMGAKIDGAGTTTIEVEGVSGLNPVTYSVIPDRIEAGTFLIAGAITGGDVTVIGAREDHLELVLSKLEETGARIEQKVNGIRIVMEDRPQAVDVATLPYPGFPTDLQPQIVALLSLAEGVSIVTENIFENRFIFVDDLNRMGSDIRTEGHHAVIKGIKELTGAEVKVRDLRGGAALVLAGLAAEGTTEAADIFHIDRGYENLETKLADLGADIKRVEEPYPVEEIEFV